MYILCLYQYNLVITLIQNFCLNIIAAHVKLLEMHCNFTLIKNL